MKPATIGVVTGGTFLLALFAGWQFWGSDPDVVTTSGDEAVVQQPSGQVLPTPGDEASTDRTQNAQAGVTDSGQQDGQGTPESPGVPETPGTPETQSTQSDTEEPETSTQETQTAALTVPKEVTAPKEDAAGQDDGDPQPSHNTDVGTQEDPEASPNTSDDDGTQTAALDPNAGEASDQQDATQQDSNEADATDSEQKDDQSDGDGSDAATDQEPAEADQTDPVDPLAPRFDVVRVDPTGQTVLAGKAPPGSQVEIVLDGVVVATETADAQGGFVTILDIALTGDAQNLQLRVPLDDGEESVPETTVVTTEPEGSEAKQDATVSSDTQQDATTGAETQAPAANPEEPDQEAAQLDDQEPQVQNTEDTLTGPNLVNGKVPPVGSELSTDTAAGDAGTLADTKAPEDPTPAQPQIVEGPEVPSVEIAAIEPSAVSTDGASVNSDSGSAAQLNVQPQQTAGLGTVPVSAAPNAPEEVGTGRYRLSAPVIILPSSEEGAAPTLVQPDVEELALIQPSGGDIRGVVLERISYSNVGDVKLSGRGREGRAIRIYGNGLLIGTTRVTQDGTWALALASERGKAVKLFRFDEIETDGSVSSRIETPFEYSSLSPKIVRERRVVIQRGDVLWRIAEQFYGEGIRYSHIYGANTELIRDPDLIYPGQVFSIPELVDAN